MTRQRTAAVVRGIGSFLLLLVLLIGPPLALATLVGWPLPTEVPEPSVFDQAIRSGVNDDIVVKGLALIAWVAWVQIAAAIVTEIVAVVRGRPSIHLPVVPGIQATVGRLVASIAMITATFAPATAVAAAARPLPIVEFAVPPAAAFSAQPVWDAAPPKQSDRVATATRPGVEPATVTVERHDSLWGIAERTLGDGYRWREIRDLNVGRTMNTGHVVLPGSDLVHPGWVLELPADAQRVPLRASDPATSTFLPSEVTVEPGDNFWDLAEERLASASGEQPSDTETAAYWQDMTAANQDRLVKPGNPDLILPGQRLCVPPTRGFVVPPADPSGPPVAQQPPELHPGRPPADEPIEVLPEAGPAPTTTPPTTPRTIVTPADADRGVTAMGEASDAPVPQIAAGLASAALAVGATREVMRRRRRVGHRAPQARPKPTSEGSRQVHRDLVADADEVVVDDLRWCLGNLAQALAATDSATRPRIVQHGPDHLDLFLSAPNDEPPTGWRAQAEGAVWSLHAIAPAGANETDPICAAPLLVTLGQPDDGGQLYLDLEADGVIALTGEPLSARAVARSILTELALTPLADTLEVLVVGDLAPPEVKGLDHVTLASSWDDVREDVAAWAEQSHEVLAVKHWANPFVARGHDPHHDALVPIAVIAHEPPPPDLLDLVLVHRPATLAVVAVGETRGATAIECTPESLLINDLGLVCIPYPLEPEVLDTIVDLVDTADDSASPCDGQLSLLEPTVLEPSTTGPAQLLEPEYDVLVRVLGDIRIEGCEPLAAKQTAVITYIALHREVAIDRLEDAVWASQANTNRRKRLANTISECRALVGRRHLPAAADGRYHAGPRLITDLELFDYRVRRAADQLPSDAAETLLAAMELVTGRLFNYRNADRASFAWVDVENWVSICELKVAAVAQRCTDLLLDLGRGEEAVELALGALAVIPTHAGLTESLMRAHAANGNRLAVQRVYEEHVGALHALNLDDAMESTSELFELLLESRAG